MPAITEGVITPFKIMGAWNPNLRNNFKSRIQVFLDVIERSFDKNNERRN